MKAKITAAIAAAALLLAGCADADSSDKGASAPTEASSSQTDSSVPESSPEESSGTGESRPDTAPETSRPRQMKDKVTGKGLSVSDYNVSVKVKLSENGDYTKEVKGEITDPDRLNEIWEVIGMAEDTQPATGISIGGQVYPAEVRLEPKSGGEPVIMSVCTGICFEGEDGGADLIVLSGRATVDGDTFCVHAGQVGHGGFNAKWFYDYCCAALEPGEEPDSQPSAEPARKAADPLTAGHTFDEYTFTATYKTSNWKEAEEVVYEGVITEEQPLNELWDMLCKAEQLGSDGEKFETLGQPELSDIASLLVGAWITVTPKRGGQPVLISCGIAYPNAMEPGGPMMLFFDGLTAPDGGMFMVRPQNLGEGYDENWLADFCKKYIAKEEFEKQRNVIQEEVDDALRGTNIVLISRYENWAEGVVDKVTWIDSMGYIYSYSLAEGEDYGFKPLSMEKLLIKLNYLMTDSESKAGPIGRVDYHKAEEIKKLAEKISPDAVMTPDVNVTFDGGQTTLYAVAGRIIELDTVGDNEHELDDPNYKEIREIYNDMMKNAERFEKIP